ncbi:hypothetical protein BOX15_Mlig021275g1 [Macrostomum lignano]|uniref:Uncharacterized protein n=1 Tax=Macrostomum lignano TaxID=282301 RepID=A0A267EF15_9PLAT|nr:hypothetical protein BOX15_Mlig021275g1 [Macrostomum lignano]
MSNLKDIFEIIGSAVGTVKDCTQLAKELNEVFGKELAQLTQSEARIKSEIQTKLANMIRQCEKSAREFEAGCQLFLGEWERVQEKMKMGVDNRRMLSLIQDLLPAARKINSSYAKLDEVLQSALRTATDLAERCKVGINSANESKSNTKFYGGGLTLAGLTCGSLVAVLSGFVGAPLLASGGGACLIAFKAYDRISRLNQLIDDFKTNLNLLEDKIRLLNSQADSVAGKATEIQVLSKYLELAETKIKGKQREQAEIEAAAQKVCVPSE